MTTKAVNKQQNQEQVYLGNRYSAIKAIAVESGFDQTALDHAEFCLIPFFDAIVELCARSAENHAQHYTGENQEHVGCAGAASAIRALGKNIGNTKETVYTVYPK